jgi:hypothetical protein
MRKTIARMVGGGGLHLVHNYSRGNYGSGPIRLFVPDDEVPENIVSAAASGACVRAGRDEGFSIDEEGYPFADPDVSRFLRLTGRQCVSQPEDGISTLQITGKYRRIPHVLFLAPIDAFHWTCSSDDEGAVDPGSPQVGIDWVDSYYTGVFDGVMDGSPGLSPEISQTCSMSETVNGITYTATAHILYGTAFKYIMAIEFIRTDDEEHEPVPGTYEAWLEWYEMAPRTVNGPIPWQSHQLTTIEFNGNVAGYPLGRQLPYASAFIDNNHSLWNMPVIKWDLPPVGDTQLLKMYMSIAGGQLGNYEKVIGICQPKFPARFRYRFTSGDDYIEDIIQYIGTPLYVEFE